MPEWLNTCLAKPMMPLHEAIQAADWPLCFVIDRIRQPRALSELKSLADTLLIEPLFRDTDFAELMEHGPLWVVTKPRSVAARVAARLCVDQRSGIALCVGDADAGLRHARHLLKVKSAGNLSLFRYYDPAVWTGCALAAGEQAAALYGCWHEIYSPAAQGRGEEDLWLKWPNPRRESDPFLDAPLNMHAAMLAASETQRWSYWVYQHSAQFSYPSDQQLPQLITNLRCLVEHGLQEPRHLLQLPALVTGRALVERSDVMGILSQGLPPHSALPQLHALTAS